MYIYKYILCILYLAHMELIPHQVGEYGWNAGRNLCWLFMFGDNLPMLSIISSNLKEKNAPVENWSNCWVTGGGWADTTQTPKHQVSNQNSREHQFHAYSMTETKLSKQQKNYTIPAVLQIGYFQQGIKYRLELNQGITFYKKLVGYTNDRKGDQNGTAKCKGWILPNAVNFNLKQGSFQYQPKQSTMCFSTGNPLKTSYICI